MREYEDYERGEEIKAMGQAAGENLKAILAAHDADNIAQLARYAYKYTDCGAAVGALLYAGKDNPGKWVYGSDLNNLESGDFIAAISISSIVEGVEQCTETHVIDLFDEAFETPAHAAAAYDAAMQSVEDEATEIWKQTHGCPTCAKHFGKPYEGDDGITPVWDDCPDCNGSGAVI